MVPRAGQNKQNRHDEDCRQKDVVATRQRPVCFVVTNDLNGCILHHLCAEMIQDPSIRTVGDNEAQWQLPRRDYILLPAIFVITILLMLGGAEAIIRFIYVQADHPYTCRFVTQNGLSLSSGLHVTRQGLGGVLDHRAFQRLRLPLSRVLCAATARFLARCRRRIIDSQGCLGEL